MHFRNSNFKHKMKRLQSTKTCVQKLLRTQNIAAVNLSKTQRKYVNQISAV